MCEGFWVVTVPPSPKSHAYEVTVPPGSVDPEPSKEQAPVLSQLEVNAATGFWLAAPGSRAIVHMIALSLEEFVVAVRPPYEPAATGPPESATIELNRPEVPVSYEVSRTVTPDGAVHADTAVDLSVHHDTTQSPAVADTVAVV
jgi:hypothetical protein